AKQDGEPLPPPGGRGDPGRGLLRAVRPRAGGVLRHRRDCRAGGGAGHPRQGAGRGAREAAAGECGRRGGRRREDASRAIGRLREQASRAQGRL
ncbi:MAG: hypothetical protein AVDCRST_MAG03-274, partial [uncultured Rubrobacteraceae bacterium]